MSECEIKLSKHELVCINNIEKSSQTKKNCRTYHCKINYMILSVEIGKRLTY